jgi:ABC-type transport system involved in cytochrome c biogenesis ATPase subunit
MKEYSIVRNEPVAKFYYQGSHSHPIKRTVLVIENTKQYIRGYEMREGADVRHVISQAPIKSYKKNKIAKISQCRKKVRDRIPNKLHTKTTYERQQLVDLIIKGF